MNKCCDESILHEVIFEIQFINKRSDPTIPGMFYDKIKEKYPDKHDGRGLDIKIQTSEKGELKNEVGFVQNIQFFKKDRSSSIILRSDILTIKCSKYMGWDKFKEEIIYALNHYASVADIKGIRSVLLRYVNKVNLDISVNELSKYFNYYPTIPNKYSEKSEAFQLNTIIPYGDNKLVLILASVPAGKNFPEKNTIFYDIGYVLKTPEKVTLDEIQDWLKEAHDKIKEAFKAGITDECKTF